MVGLRYELTDIKIDQRGLYSLLHSQRGPVAEQVREVGRRTVVAAKSLSGVRTGRLKRSIKMERDRSNPREYAVLVGFRCQARAGASSGRPATCHHGQASRRDDEVPQGRERPSTRSA